MLHPFPRSHPRVPRHAADCVEAGGIDAKILEQIFAHMEADDFADHDHASEQRQQVAPSPAGMLG